MTKHHRSNKRCDSDESHKKCYDVIIVGAGTTGSALAKYVSDAGISVLVLEQGENQNDNISVKYPNGGAFGNNGDPDNLYGFVAKDFVNLIQPGFDPKVTDSITAADVKGKWDVNNQMRAAMHGGRNWGGANAHNYLSYYRTSSQFDQKIADEFVAPKYKNLWNASVMTNIKNEIETYIPVDGPVGAGGRGTTGPIIASKAADNNPPYLQKITELLVDPFVNGVDTAISCPIVSDINQIGTTTVRVQNLNNFIQNPTAPGPQQLRSHAGEAFLGPTIVDQQTGKGVNGRKLQVISKAFVNKVHFDHRKVAQKVEAIVDGKTEYYSAKHKIVLCAGALRTPGILERSGVGDSSILTPLGIDVVHHNSHVGANYRNQPAVTTFGTINPDLAVFLGQEQANLSFPGGSPFGLDRYSTHRWIGGPIRAFDPYFPANGWLVQMGGNYDAVNTITSFSYNFQPKSVGTCHITNSDPFTQPTLLRNSFTTDEDVRFAVETIRFNKRLEQKLATELPELNYKLILPPSCTDFNDDEVMAQWGATLNFMTDHSMGTCKMGPNENEGVVDGKLRVFGVKHLMIADSSIWPIPTDISTAAPALMLGRQAARFIVDDL